MYPSVHRSIIHGGQDVGTTKVLNKEDGVHIYNGILLSLKKKMKHCHL